METLDHPHLLISHSLIQLFTSNYTQLLSLLTQNLKRSNKIERPNSASKDLPLHAITIILLLIQPWFLNQANTGNLTILEIESDR